MNFWTERSIELANQKNYLDELFRVYPMNPELSREIDEEKWGKVESCFNARNDQELLNSLLQLELFPIKDSYVAYLRRDKNAIKRNPMTVARLCGRIYELGLDEVRKRCEQPKETNRQIGPMFRHWLQSGACGIPLVSGKDFLSAAGNAILDESDKGLQDWCKVNLGYQRKKGLDFVAKIKGKYIVGEAKFLTDFGGHQNAQLEDAFATLRANMQKNVLQIILADGVCYIPGKNKLYSKIVKEDAPIMSALFLRDFLHSF